VPSRNKYAAAGLTPPQTTSTIATRDQMRVCDDGLCKRKFALATEPSRIEAPSQSSLRCWLDPNNRIVVINRESAQNCLDDFFSYMDEATSLKGSARS
jgi:hypothetical protein